MFAVLGEVCTLLFICIFGGKSARRSVTETLAENCRELDSMHAHHLASGYCVDRMVTEWGEAMYPDYRKVLNEQRTLRGLPLL